MKWRREQRLQRFTLHYFEGGLKTISNKDVAGKATILSVVPSLDTAFVRSKRRNFNQELGALGGQRKCRPQSVEICRSLRTAFCGAEGRQEHESWQRLSKRCLW